MVIFRDALVQYCIARYHGFGALSHRLEVSFLLFERKAYHAKSIEEEASSPHN